MDAFSPPGYHNSLLLPAKLRTGLLPKFLDFLELAQSLRSDFKRLKPYIANIRKLK